MKRLRDETSSDFVQSLLDSAAADVPSPQAEERALRAAERELVLPKAWPRGWVAGGTIVGIGALLLLLGQAYPPAKTNVPAVPAPPSAVPTTATPAIEATPPDPTVAPTITAPPPSVSPSAASPASASARPTMAITTATVAPPPSASTVAGPMGLKDELALIDEARTDLAQGNAPAALATLGRYDTRFPQGLLREEATAVRIEALFAAGRTNEARTASEAFLREHPASTHAQHVRSLLDSHAP